SRTTPLRRCARSSEAGGRWRTPAGRPRGPAGRPVGQRPMGLTAWDGRTGTAGPEAPAGSPAPAGLRRPPPPGGAAPPGAGGAGRTGRFGTRRPGSGRPGMASRTGPPTVTGRWSLLPRADPDPTRRLHAVARTLLERHGILTRGAVAAERAPGGFGALYPV